eukprot:scaffold1711_cov60-Attheya_sp.AAC.7
MCFLVSYYCQRIETLQKEIEGTNTNPHKTESALHDATQSFFTADIISGASESELTGNDYNYFLGLVDNCYEIAFRSHFCKWQHADVPLLDNTTHDVRLHMFESKFPITATKLNSISMTQENKRNSQLNVPHILEKWRITFNSFLALSRVRNPYKLTWWASITDSLASAS